jgi:hypothetical protein
MMNKLMVAAAAVSVMLVAGSPAYADSASPALAASKNRVTHRIDLRLAALHRFGTALGNAEKVQPAHRAALNGLISEQTAELTALRTKVAGETSTDAVKADATSMVDDFRVFLLTEPKVRLTAVIDTELAVAAALGDKADGVEKSLSGEVDTLLAIQPGPDRDAIEAGLKPVRQAAHTARTQLKSLK